MNKNNTPLELVDLLHHFNIHLKPLETHECEKSELRRNPIDNDLYSQDSKCRINSDDLKKHFGWMNQNIALKAQWVGKQTIRNVKNF